MRPGCQREPCSPAPTARWCGVPRRLPPGGADLQPGQGGPALSGLELTQRGQARRRRLTGLPHEESGESSQNGGHCPGVCGPGDRVIMKSVSGDGPPCIWTLGSIATRSNHGAARQAHGQSTTTTRSEVSKMLSARRSAWTNAGQLGRLPWQDRRGALDILKHQHNPAVFVEEPEQPRSWNPLGNRGSNTCFSPVDARGLGVEFRPDRLDESTRPGRCLQPGGHTRGEAPRLRDRLHHPPAELLLNGVPQPRWHRGPRHPHPGGGRRRLYAIPVPDGRAIARTAHPIIIPST